MQSIGKLLRAELPTHFAESVLCVSNESKMLSSSRKSPYSARMDERINWECFSFLSWHPAEFILSPQCNKMLSNMNRIITVLEEETSTEVPQSAQVIWPMPEKKTKSRPPTLWLTVQPALEFPKVCGYFYFLSSSVEINNFYPMV